MISRWDYSEEGLTSQNIKGQYKEFIRAGQLDAAWDFLEKVPKDVRYDAEIKEGHCFYPLIQWTQNRKLDLLREKTPFLKREGLLSDLKQDLKKKMTLLEDYSFRNENPQMAEQEVRRRLSEEFDHMSPSMALPKQIYIQSKLEEWRHSLDHLSQFISSQLDFYSLVGTPVELAELYSGFAEMISEEGQSCEVAISYWKSALHLLESVSQKESLALDENLNWGVQGTLKKLLSCYSTLGMDEEADRLLTQYHRTREETHYVPSDVSQAVEAFGRMTEALAPHPLCEIEHGDSTVDDPSWIPVGSLFLNEEGNFCSNKKNPLTQQTVCYETPNSSYVTASKPFLLGNRVYVLTTYGNELHVLIYDRDQGHLLKNDYVGEVSDDSNPYGFFVKDGSVFITNKFQTAVIDPIRLEVSMSCIGDDQFPELSKRDNQKYISDVFYEMNRAFHSRYINVKNLIDTQRDPSAYRQTIMARLALKYLRHGDPDLKRKTIDFLFSGSDAWKPTLAQIYPTLLHALNDPDIQDKKSESTDGIFELFGSIPETVFPLATKSLEDTDPQVRSISAEILAKLKWDSSVTLPALSRALLDPDLGVRVSAAAALSGLGQENPEIRNIALDAMKNDDPKIRRKGLNSIGSIHQNDEEIIFKIINALKDPEEENRELAAIKLGELKISTLQALQALTKALEDHNNSVADHAQDALVKIGDPSIPFLAKALENPNGRVRSDAAHALNRLHKKLQIAIPELRKALKDSESSVRFESCEALSSMGAEASIAARDMAQLLDDDDPDIREQAAFGLGQLGDSSPEIISSLINHLGQDTDLRHSLAVSLSTLGYGNDQAILALEDRFKDYFNPSIARALALTGPKGISRLQSLLHGYDDSIATTGLIWALGQVKPEDAKVVIPILESKLGNETFRLEAVRALGNLGEAASASIPKLLSLKLKDEDKSDVAEALSHMGPQGAKALLKFLQREKIPSPDGLRRLGANGQGVKEDLWNLFLAQNDMNELEKASFALGYLADAVPQEKNEILQKFEHIASLKGGVTAHRVQAIREIDRIEMSTESSNPISNSIYYERLMDKSENEDIRLAAAIGLSHHADPKSFSDSQIQALVQQLNIEGSPDIQEQIIYSLMSLDSKLTPHIQSLIAMLDQESMADSNRYHLRELIKNINYPNSSPIH